MDKTKAPKGKTDIGQSLKRKIIELAIASTSNFSIQILPYLCFSKVGVFNQWSNYMFTNDEDDFLMGSPKSKFFDIVYNANRSLAEQSIEGVFDKYCAMELLLEKYVEDDNELEYLLNEIIFNRTDELEERKNSLFIAATGDVLTQHE